MATGGTSPQARHAPRYEFRIFRRSLGSLPDQLGALAGADRFEASAEHYVLVAGVTGTSLKLRDGALELKTLRATRGRLERWEPMAAVDLPARGSALANLLRPAGIGRHPPEAGTAEDLRAWLSGVPGVAVVPVRKRRQKYVLEGVRAEITEVVARGRTIRSLALEGEDPRRLDALVAQLGLRDADNTSYPRQLGALLKAGGEADPPAAHREG
jgi:hypothetical protein